MLKFYNTLTRKKESFKPLKKGEVGMYNCGPTVYHYAHIGNFRAYICSDLIRRYLEYCGYKVKQIMNITDVDDKTIRDSRKEGISLKQFTDRYTKTFFEDIETLRIKKASKYPKATEHIEDMVNLIKKLQQNNHTYNAEGSTYFKISSFKDYGKLAKLNLENLKAGARVSSDEYEKESAHDFALWKAWTEEDGDVFWDTEIGKGRPGWHIECSAMSSRYLGQPFDIHTGGVDLIFPHHTNEIAQSEGANKKQFVKCWLHNEHILVDGKKMSKSLGNFYTLRDLLKKGYNPKAIRYTLLATHYRQQLNFTLDGIQANQNAVDRLQDFVDTLAAYKEGKDNPKVKQLIKKAKDAFTKEMDDDLNISPALGIIFDFVHQINILMGEKNISEKDAQDTLLFMRELNSVLDVIDFEQEELDEEIQQLIEKREEARNKKDYTAADKIRDQLLKKGIQLLDTPEGVRWKKV